MRLLARVVRVFFIVFSLMFKHLRHGMRSHSIIRLFLVQNIAMLVKYNCIPVVVPLDDLSNFIIIVISIFARKFTLALPAEEQQSTTVVAILGKR